jgi:hypothetical protein
MGPRAGLDAVEKRKRNPLPCRESIPGLPAHSSVTILTELPQLRYCRYKCIFRPRWQLCEVHRIIWRSISKTWEAIDQISDEARNVLPVQVVGFGRWDGVLAQFGCVVCGGRGMVRQTLQSYFLFCHQFTWKNNSDCFRI